MTSVHRPMHEVASVITTNLAVEASGADTILVFPRDFLATPSGRESIERFCVALAASLDSSPFTWLVDPVTGSLKLMDHRLSEVETALRALSSPS